MLRQRQRQRQRQRRSRQQLQVRQKRCPLLSPVQGRRQNMLQMEQNEHFTFEQQQRRHSGSNSR